MKISGKSALNYIINGLILVIPFFIPLFNLTFDVGSILTVISVLFTILAGFFIAAATSNYLRLQTLITSLNASMISMFDLARIIDPASKEKVADAIDEYMISALDYDLLDFASKTEDELQKVVAVVDKIKPKNNHLGPLIQNLHDQKVSLYSSHQEMSVATKRIVGTRHWVILITLSSLIAMLTLELRDGQVLSYIMVSALLFAIYQVLKLLHEIDSNLFLAKKLAFETPQQVFRLIGRLHYYPKYALDAGVAKMTEIPYRVGVYTDSPNSYKKKIEIVKIK